MGLKHAQTRLGITGLLLAITLAGCNSETPSGDDHKVFFAGYVYDGASGARLTKAQLTGVSIKYREKVIVADIEADGRFLTKTPLPTWQDYSVYIAAAGFRPFVSQNPGIDVPASVAMTDGLVAGSTTQTFVMEARLFPVALKAPKVTLTIDQADFASLPPGTPRVAGQVRFAPRSLSFLEASPSTSSSSVRTRRWLNDEDLNNQSITKPFVDGLLEVAEGELVYGVSYEVTVFNVPGYQAKAFPDLLIAGQVASRTFVLSKEQKDPLRILATNVDTCLPPAGNSTEFGAAIFLDFNEPIEFVSATAAEDIDNGITVGPTGPLTYPQTGSYCSLRPSASSTVQERGSKATIAASRLTLSFNPSIGLATGTISFPCMPPANLSFVAYGNLQNVSVRPIGDNTRKRTLSELFAAFASASGFSTQQIVCGSKLNQF
ncbi:MAG: hypothetical protein SF187_13590 [Deltaproteobacteria bacterium]|nr:hypothetical protein [Deltaproteobacteria bacterium]